MTQNKEYKEFNIIDPNSINSYKPKKNFTGFYIELNPEIREEINWNGNQSPSEIFANLGIPLKLRLPSFPQIPENAVQFAIAIRAMRYTETPTRECFTTAWSLQTALSNNYWPVTRTERHDNRARKYIGYGKGSDSNISSF